MNTKGDQNDQGLIPCRPPTAPRNSVTGLSLRTTGKLTWVPGCSNPLELFKMFGGAGVQPCAKESLHTNSSTTTTTNVLIIVHPPAISQARSNARKVMGY